MSWVIVTGAWRLVVAKTIMVLGGTGTFGRLILADLLSHTPHKLISASRRGIAKGDWLPGAEGRVSSVCVDGSQERALLQLLERERADVLIHAAGPYANLQSVPLSAAIASKIHYADMCPRSDLYLDYQKKLAEKTADIYCVVGASTAGGVTGILTMHAQSTLSTLKKISSYLCVHNFRWGKGAVADYLLAAKIPLAEGRRNTSPEAALFPPIGLRTLRLADSLESIGYTRDFQVEYRFGLDGFLPSHGMSIASALSRAGLPLWRMGGILGKLAGLLGGARTEGGLLHRAFGTSAQGPGILETHLHRPFGNVRVPGLLCALLAAKMAGEGLHQRGWMHPRESMSFDALRSSLEARAVELRSRFIAEGQPLNQPW
jgi:hypothetical protein